MKNRIGFLLFSIVLSGFGIPSASGQFTKNKILNTDSVFDSYRPPKTHPWRAAAEVVGLDVGILSFDHFIEHNPGAQVTFKTMGDNLKYGFVWDNDAISTNMFWHPFTGGLYFNAARSNNLNFWQSIPYAFAGSFLWEYFGESNPPSLNDVIATPVGGIALGEISHRVTFMILNERKRGWARVGNEVLAGIISPMGLLTRLLNGDAWRVRSSAYRDYNASYANAPFLADVSLTSRVLTDVDQNRSHVNMALSGELIYGRPFIDDVRSPYDFFTANMDMNIIGNQPLISNVSVAGLIYGKEWKKNANHCLAGVFQHFDYYDADPVISGGKQPYEFAETAAFGGGLLFKHQRDENKLPSFSGAMYVNLILLGTSESDYYQLSNRDYNIGNGYSVKLNGMFFWGKRWTTELGVKHYQIFTTQGYGSAEAEINGVPEDINYQYANVQGNKGNALLSMINASVGYQISDKWRLSAEQRFFIRNSHYIYFPDVMSSSTENRLQLTYTIVKR